MKKQMNYANALGVAYVALVGENEMNEGKVTLKNMTTGEQKLISLEEMINMIKK
jgi:histidyl-tRNA synthetase